MVSRRDFLKGGIGGVAALAAGGPGAPSLLRGEGGRRPPDGREDTDEPGTHGHGSARP